MPDYIITTDRKALEEFQAKVNTEFSYPEQGHQFVNVGIGPHCHWTVGRAMNFAPIEEHKDGGIFALPLTSTQSAERLDAIVAIPKDTQVVDKLPDGWREEVSIEIDTEKEEVKR